MIDEYKRTMNDYSDSANDWLIYWALLPVAAIGTICAFHLD